MLIWRPLGAHTLINIPWVWESSDVLASWTWCFHTGGLGLTPAWGTKSLKAAHCGQRKMKEKKGRRKKEKKKELKRKQTEKQNRRQIAKIKANKRQQQHNTHTEKKNENKQIK